MLLLGSGYFLFYCRDWNWAVFWAGWLIYAAMWLLLQGFHTAETPNFWTYFFLFSDVAFFVLANYIEPNILNNYSALLILPLFQYLLRYGRRMALLYTGVCIAAIIFICLIQYMVHPANHFVVAAVMFFISYNEGLLVQENNELRKQLISLAIFDELTGLYNYRFFAQAIERELNRCKRYGYPLTLLLIDIDDFKKINDAFGHEKGNEVLKTFSAIITEQLRDSDYAARYGGEELVVILPQTNSGEGLQVAERLRERIAGQTFSFGHVTVSIGVSTYPEPSGNKEDLINNADTALYAAKKSGKNTVKKFIP